MVGEVKLIHERVGQRNKTYDSKRLDKRYEKERFGILSFILVTVVPQRI